MITVPKIEMHLAHACNLSCQGCTHYADHGLSGTVSLADGEVWLRSWARRIVPVRLSLLGGEPLLNRETPDFLRLARGLWPHTRIRLVTNGLLLRRSKGLWEALAETNGLLTVSIHSLDPAYLAELAPLLDLARSKAENLGFGYEERDSVSGWYKLYRNEGPFMEPFQENDPRGSWTVCENKHCVTLQDNALWKCPPLAHLPRLAQKYHLADRPTWAPYLRYEPLGLDASDEEIAAFFSRRQESYCGMCPTRLEYFEKTIH